MHKLRTLESYRERLDRVTSYIHDHLEDELSFDRLAEIACLSPYHWSRIYHAIQGETIANTIRRLRLQRAADRLANTAMEVSEIVEHAKYGSAEAFGRAFKDMFGLPPASYRAKGSHAAFAAANAAVDAEGFPTEIVELPERRCAGIDHVGSYIQIDRAMSRLFSDLSAQGVLPTAPAMIGLFFDDPGLGPEEALRSRAVLPIEPGVEIGSPLVETILRGGSYARLSYTGPYADMRGAYRWLLGTWLPASGLEPGDAPIFEAYLNDPREVPQNQLRTDIHLPLQALA
ncbi:MAG TPA: AraC family transcriptional regulator [Devosia sp.]|jgi:AraC family transcriptional regulator|uniref:AraC family transcriptional regulator n=1 Tax=Devosia sp. TaxID=1871048 RepID=UPI002F94E328